MQTTKTNTNGLFFVEDEEDFPITHNGQVWQFKIIGLNDGTTDEIASKATRSLSLDKNEKPVAQLDPGLFYHGLLKRGVIEAPCEWTDENIKRLHSAIRTKLVQRIVEKSDGIGEFQKKSGAPLVDGATSTPKSIDG